MQITRLGTLFAFVMIAACKTAAPATSTTPAPAPIAAAPTVRAAGEMVGVLARFKMLPGKEDEATALFRETAAKVQEASPGVLTYLFLRNKKDPQEIVVIEIYEDAAARDAHINSQIMTEARPKLGALIDTTTLKIEHLDGSFLGFDR